MKNTPVSPRGSLRRRLLAEIRHAAPTVPLVAGACLSVSAYAQTVSSNQSSTYNLGGTTTSLTVDPGVAISTSSGAGISGGGSSVAGVTITNNGTVSESDSTGVVTSSGIYLSKSGTVNNNGTITGSGWSGVYLKSGGEVDNFGTIVGTHDGIELNGASGTIVNGSASNTSAFIHGTSGPAVYNSLSSLTSVNLTNYGTLSSSGVGFAVALAGGGTITNHGIISGSRGVYLSTGTLVNYGTITATSGIFGVALGTGSTLELETGSSIAGSVVGGGGSLILDGTNSMSNTVSSFNSLTMQGTDWTLAGNVTASHTNVTSGVLNVTGTLTSSSGVTVASGAKLAGTGTVAANVTAQSGATVQAGTAGTPGTLSINGNYVQQSGATLEIANTTTSASLVSILGGSATLGGTLLVDSAAGDYSHTLQFIIMTATGGLTGTFGAVLDSNADVVPTLTYDTTNDRVILRLAKAALWTSGDNNVTLSGNITTAQNGSGGTDTLNLVGTSNVTADLTNIGTLNVGTSSSTASAVSMTSGTQQFQSTTIYPNATLTLNSSGFVPGTLTLAGGTLDAKADFSDTAPVAVSANSQISADAGHTVTLAGNMTGAGGVQKSGDGMLVLNGQNTYSGGTSVSGGTLEVGDIDHASASLTGNVDVAAAGTLRGHGTVAGDVSNLGTVRPGGSIGTLTVNGNYTQAPGATLMVDVTPTGASMLKVGGTATLGGALSLVYAPGTYTASTFRILQAAAINGTFSSISGNTPAGFTQGVAVSGTAVDLSLTSPTVVVAPTNATIFGTLGASAIRDGQQVNALLLDRIAPCSASACSTGDFTPRYHGWVQASANSARVRGNHDAPSYNDHRYGFIAGLDRELGAWTTGIAGGYSHADLSEDQTGSTGSVDTLRLAVYGGRRVGIVDLAADAGAAYDFLSTKREFGALGKTDGDGNGQEITAAMQAGVPMHLAGFLLTPSIGARYAYFHGGAFSESGVSGQDLSVGTQNFRSLQPYAAVSADYAFRTIHGQSAAIQARVGYAYETLGAGRGVSVAASDGTGFFVPGATSSRSMLTAGLGVSLPVTKALKLTADWNTLFDTGNTSAQTFKVGVDYRF